MRSELDALCGKPTCSQPDQTVATKIYVGSMAQSPTSMLIQNVGKSSRIHSWIWPSMLQDASRKVLTRSKRMLKSDGSRSRRAGCYLPQDILAPGLRSQHLILSKFKEPKLSNNGLVILSWELERYCTAQIACLGPSSNVYRPMHMCWKAYTHSPSWISLQWRPYITSKKHAMLSAVQLSFPKQIRMSCVLM